MKTYSFFVFVVAVILLGCANPKPPSGGPPDKTPPKVIDFYPRNMTTKFADKKIYIVFSKWVDRNSVLNNIFLNPPLKYEAKWSGKKLYISFLEDLPKNITISFFLGTNYADLDGNKPNEPFSLFFSTGEFIDSGFVVGKVLAKDLTKTFIYAIPTSLISDSLKDINKIFHYRTQPNLNGIFKFEAVKPGSYILVAFSDNNGNKEFDKGIDGLGICSDSILISPVLKDTVAIIVANPKDVTPPQLFDIVCVSKNVVKLKFSEPIRLDSNFALQDFIISDTSGRKESSPEFVSLNPDEPSALFVYFKDKLVQGDYYFKLKKHSLISDTSGNKLDFKSPIRFRVPAEIPLFEPDLQAKKMILSTPLQEIYVAFNIPLDTAKTNLKLNLVNFAKKDTIPLKFRWKSNFEIAFNYANIRWRSNFILIISSDSIVDYFGNKFVSRKFTQSISVTDEPSVGTIKGKLLAGIDTTQGKAMIMAIGKERTYFVHLRGLDWSFVNLPEGEYTLVAFYDRNGDGFYDFGDLFPIKFSEKIIRILDKIQVRKSWTVEEIKF